MGLVLHRSEDGGGVDEIKIGLAQWSRCAIVLKWHRDIAIFG